ncbi:MAG TPA: hypothetical protein VHZ04_01245 [Candidatus Paceibacterota bacterium]|jgi:hypothetical protein|nr:hypothetical protein [Candidatus Paceibacterota bacterium]
MSVRRWIFIAIGAIVLTLCFGSFLSGEEAQNVYADSDNTPPTGVKHANTASLSNVTLTPHVFPPIRARRENLFLAFGKFATDVVPVAKDPDGTTHVFYSAGLVTAEAMGAADCVTTEMIHARGGSEADPLTRPLFRYHLECPVGIVFSNAANHTLKLLFEHAGDASGTKWKKAGAYTVLALYDVGYGAIIAHNIQQLERPRYREIYQQGR